ncbi:hypothetical protein [Halopelagius fulvigenes]|uniref:Uncharacterized protein n=1 Tax=Halopelagius fulvigenes TaxID=1198324 RepID=A0ABD5TX23_9EURY
MTVREVQCERPVCPTCGAPAAASVSDGPRMGDDFAVYECVSCGRLVEIDASFDVSRADWTVGSPTVRAPPSVERTAPSSVKSSIFP